MFVDAELGCRRGGQAFGGAERESPGKLLRPVHRSYIQIPIQEVDYKTTRIRK